MPAILPPSPNGVPPGHSFWNDWYEKLRMIINDVATSIVQWTAISFTGSNITDIQSRDHNNLQNLQGGTAGEKYHLSLAQNTALTSGGVTALHTHDHETLTSLQGGAIGEHYHMTALQSTHLGELPMTSQLLDPVVADITASYAKLYKNTTSGDVKLWVNDGGTLKSVTLT